VYIIARRFPSRPKPIINEPHFTVSITSLTNICAKVYLVIYERQKNGRGSDDA
jgi:hypothetical protein